MARRKSGTGGISKRKDGRWEGRVVIGYDEKGLPKTKNVLAKTKFECQEKLDALRGQLQKSVGKATSGMTFGEWMDFWFREYASMNLKETTKSTYRNRIYRQIIPKLGHIPLKSINQSDLQSFYADLKKDGRLIRKELYGDGVSDAHIKSIHSHCNAALEKAVAEGLILKNPAVGCRLPQKHTKEIQILTRDEMIRLLIQAKEDGFYEMFLLDLSTGMRRGELVALQWSDFDFDKETVLVQRQVNRVDGKLLISEPKTRSSVRTIRLSKPVLAILKMYKEQSASRWLFPSPVKEDSPRDPSACRKSLSKILEHAECKHVRFHDLRHTFVSMSLDGGIDIKTLADILGHRTVKTTLNVYSHATLDMQRSAAEKIDLAVMHAKPHTKPKDDGRANTEPKEKKPKFEPYKGKKRKPGTGYVKQISKNSWHGRYTPTIDGKRVSMNIYAKTEEECEEKLAGLIQHIKEERAAKKNSMKIKK